MGILDHLSNLRFTRAADRYAQIGSKGAGQRAGGLSATAVGGRAAAHAEQTDPSGGGGGGGGGGGVLATVGKAMLTAIGWEQALSPYLGKIPFAAIPALRIWDLDVGLPHAHNHPPNITPPNPVPIPLPSFGPVIPIPILSGATKVLINGTPAARCGDMGLGVWCGGYFPMFEVFLGSATVWIEAARAGRVAVDITKHCIFTSPKPSDPPLGPMVGTTLPPGSPNVLIGGIPFPSLFSLAIAQAFKAVFKIGGALFRRLTARSYISKLMAKGKLRINPHGAPAGWADDIMKDLEKIARTRSGRQVLNAIDNSTNGAVNLRHYNGSHGPLNALAGPHSMDAMMDIPTGLHMPGSASDVMHTPANWANHPSQAGNVAHPAPGTSSDAILFHELNHAANNAQGANRAAGTTSQHGWDQRWVNQEEYATVAAENGYRAENGLPQRTAYTNPFP